MSPAFRGATWHCSMAVGHMGWGRGGLGGTWPLGSRGVSNWETGLRDDTDHGGRLLCGSQGASPSSRLGTQG